MSFISNLDPETRLLIIHPNLQNKQQIMDELQSHQWTHVYHNFMQSITDETQLNREIAYLLPSYCIIFDGIDCVDGTILADLLEELIPQRFIILIPTTFPKFIHERKFLHSQVQLYPVDGNKYPDYVSIDTIVEVDATNTKSIRINGVDSHVLQHAYDTKLYIDRLAEIVSYLINKGDVTKGDVKSDFAKKPNPSEQKITFKEIVDYIPLLNDLTGETFLTKVRSTILVNSKNIVAIEKINVFQDAAFEALDQQDNANLIDEAINLYSDKLINSPSHWAVKVRHEMRQTYISLLLHRAKLYIANHELYLALGRARKAARLDYWRDDALKLVEDICNQIGDDALDVNRSIQQIAQKERQLNNINSISDVEQLT